MLNILDQIFADKKKELPGTQRQSPLSEIKQRIGDQQLARDVFKALEKGDTSRIIAEIKPKTPFKGELRKGFDAKIIAGDYVEYGAATLSILTESTYFGSSIKVFQEIRKIAAIPLLRKDFIFDATVPTSCLSEPLILIIVCFSTLIFTSFGISKSVP